MNEGQLRWALAYWLDDYERLCEKYPCAGHRFFDMHIGRIATYCLILRPEKFEVKKITHRGWFWGTTTYDEPQRFTAVRRAREILGRLSE